MVGKRYREANPWWGWLKLSRVQIADGIFSSLRFSRKIFICTWLSGILHEWECFSFFLFSEYLFFFSPLNGFYHAIQWGKITGLLKKAPCCEGMWGRLVLWFIISKISDFVSPWYGLLLNCSLSLRFLGIFYLYLVGVGLSQAIWNLTFTDLNKCCGGPN